MGEMRFPNESPAYREARDELLRAELDLREHVERVAAQRRRLPPGGELKEDYVFEEVVDGEPRRTRFSELFPPGRDALFVYSFMYGPDMEAACPLCTALLDGLEGQVHHLEQRIGVAVVARHRAQVLHEYARSRGWRRLRLLSSADNTYNADYYGEVDGRQWTMANVFARDGGVIRHTWGSEMVLAPPIEGGNQRHVDMFWPLWNVLDATPEGRGSDWFPALSYDEGD